MDKVRGKGGNTGGSEAVEIGSVGVVLEYPIRSG